ncbi:MAG: oxidoreductase [Chloroflexi bacterium]|nr:oxidoreductase [Ardenticatenaceae bacterium]MBL1126929.1 oxidoreductase [Chloroflexota bacterium]NOG32986.1 oxidoreductase [Chloroflexota bacterium]GIK54714.1 MAG: F420-non-reducing hydrogenase subunit G [Chloroflexota bacterium]
MSKNGQAPKEKPKFAMYWAAACGGCEIAVLNIGEKILDVDANFDVVFWPVAMDAKYKDVEAMPDKSILLTLFNGGIRNEENEHMAKLLRQKSQILVAFGSCANEGCIPGLANLSSMQEVFNAAYESVSTENPQHIRPQFSYQVPEGMLTIPLFYPVLRTLDQVVDVDYFMPGCPPESHQIAAVIDLVIAVLHGEAELPPKGAVIGVGDSTVCEECQRARNIKKITKLVRIHEVAEVDPDLCLLEQGILCNGPATRSGCGARCPSVGAACIGCYGPAVGVVDYGARLMTAVASVIDSTEPDEIEAILDGIPDPAGTFYRFNLAHSLLHAARPAMEEVIG